MTELTLGDSRLFPRRIYSLDRSLANKGFLINGETANDPRSYLNLQKPFLKRVICYPV